MTDAEPEQADTDSVQADTERVLRRAAAVDPARWARARRDAGDRAARDGAVEVSWAAVSSPVGPLLAAATGDGLVAVAFDGDGRDVVLDRLARLISPRVLEAPVSLGSVRAELEAYFAGRLREFALPLDWRLVGGTFAKRVLEATAAVPFGQTRTYTEVAAAAGNPRGPRAAGRALGANPLLIVVPCHRVLRSGGALGGYAGGLGVKRFLLDLEQQA